MLPRALRFKRPLHRCNACNPNANAKAELNRRSQVCEVLAGTGISRRKSIPKRTEPGARPLLRLCEVSVGMPGSLGKMDEHQGIAPCIPRWKRSVYLSTPMLGRMESRKGVAPFYTVLQTAALNCSANGTYRGAAPLFGTAPV